MPGGLLPHYLGLKPLFNKQTLLATLKKDFS
jgi:hypothetical protein